MERLDLRLLSDKVSKHLKYSGLNYDFLNNLFMHLPDFCIYRGPAFRIILETPVKKIDFNNEKNVSWAKSYSGIEGFLKNCVFDEDSIFNLKMDSVLLQADIVGISVEHLVLWLKDNDYILHMDSYADEEEILALEINNLKII